MLLTVCFFTLSTLVGSMLHSCLGLLSVHEQHQIDIFQLIILHTQTRTLSHTQTHTDLQVVR